MDHKRAPSAGGEIGIRKFLIADIPRYARLTHPPSFRPRKQSPRRASARVSRFVAVTAALVLLGGSCTDGEGGATDPATGGVPFGTLRVAMLDPLPALDPQLTTDAADWEVFRCCLLRTLYSYRPGSRIAAQVFPDLAAGTPDVSADRLTWTFRIRGGVHYAPPLVSRVISTLT